MALTNAGLYELILAALNYLQDDGGQFRKGYEKAGLTREEFWLLNRFRYFPGTVAPGDFLTYGPYASVAVYEQQLEALVGKKCAEKVEEGRYRSAESGRKLIEQQYRDYYAAVARHDRLTEPEVQRLGQLGDRVVAFLVRQPEVSATITNAARSVFPEINRPWVYAERRVTALAVFHDDAHIAAWRDDGWSGPLMAVSTVLFKATDPIPYEQLRAATSQLTDKDFKSAISALHSGAEAAHNDENVYRLTPAGRQARQVIEEMTDRNYGVIWGALTPAEMEELIALLEKLRGPIGL